MTNNHIRILRDTALHAAHAILGVTHNHHQVASNPNLVHLTHAVAMVSKGEAEWVGIAPAAAPAAEKHEDLVYRHAEEHADMLSRHASEHREMRERHAAEHKEAIAALGLAAAITGI